MLYYQKTINAQIDHVPKYSLNHRNNLHEVDSKHFVIRHCEILSSREECGLVSCGTLIGVAEIAVTSS